MAYIVEFWSWASAEWLYFSETDDLLMACGVQQDIEYKAGTPSRVRQQAGEI